jgi:hypothetical protein
VNTKRSVIIKFVLYVNNFLQKVCVGNEYLIFGSMDTRNIELTPLCMQCTRRKGMGWDELFTVKVLFPPRLTSPLYAKNISY